LPDFRDHLPAFGYALPDSGNVWYELLSVASKWEKALPDLLIADFKSALADLDSRDAMPDLAYYLPGSRHLLPDLQLVDFKSILAVPDPWKVGPDLQQALP
jgi:hypothetical protein